MLRNLRPLTPRIQVQRERYKLDSPIISPVGNLAHLATGVHRSSWVDPSSEVFVDTHGYVTLHL